MPDLYRKGHLAVAMVALEVVDEFARRDADPRFQRRASPCALYGVHGYEIHPGNHSAETTVPLQPELIIGPVPGIAEESGWREHELAPLDLLDEGRFLIGPSR